MHFNIQFKVRKFDSAGKKIDPTPYTIVMLCENGVYTLAHSFSTLIQAQKELHRLLGGFPHSMNDYKFKYSGKWPCWDEIEEATE